MHGTRLGRFGQWFQTPIFLPTCIKAQEMAIMLVGTVRYGTMSAWCYN